MANFFIDCEFTQFANAENNFATPQLLSFAVVDDTGRELYLEFGYSKTECSSWTIKHVIPLLGLIPKASVTKREGSRRLREFLAIATDSIIIVADFEGDFELFKGLLHEVDEPSIGLKVEYLQVGHIMAWPEYIDASERSFASSAPLLRHHALADARSLRAGVLAGFSTLNATFRQPT